MIYLFADRSLDPDRRELRYGADLIEVEPQVFDLILYLIRYRERVVTRDELIESVWKGRIVSESTISSRITLARHAVGDTGQEQRLIRTLPRVGLRFVGEVRETAVPGSAKVLQQVLSLSGQVPERPGASVPVAPIVLRRSALAVHPFLDLSNALDQGNLITGLADDIFAALSQFPWLSVIARNTDHDARDWALDISDRERSSALHYVLDVSVRTGDHRVRATARLADPRTGELLWAKRFDVWQEDVLELQDEITTSIVGTLGPRLEQFEIARARRDPTAHLDPVQCYLLGMGELYQWNRDAMCDALTLFQRATELDPDFAAAYGMAAYCHVQRKSYGWISDRKLEVANCARLTQQAAQCAQHDAATLTRAAHAISSVVVDIDRGADLIDQALRIDPSLAAGWYVSGWIRLFLGKPDKAIDHLERALRLGRFDPLNFKMHAALGYAHFLSGRFDRATASAERALNARPNYLTAMRLAAASHASAGRLARARGLFRRMRELDSKLRIADLPNLIPFQRRIDLERWSAALWKAGLPE